MTANRPDGEYASLREEIHMMQQRAHEVWKWGIVSLLAILGVLVSILTELDSGSRAEAGIIYIIERQAFLAGTSFLLLGAGITVLMVRLAADVRNAIGRIGAYLAVFHDGVVARDCAATRLGWHAWNRIDKFASGTPALQDVPPTPMYGFHGDARAFTALFGFYATVVVVLFRAADPSVALKLGVGGMSALAVVSLAVEFIERRSARRATLWNVRWARLARATDAEIRTWLIQSSLAEPARIVVPAVLADTPEPVAGP